MTINTSKPSPRSLKICCGVTLVFVIIIVVVITTLWFTIFKPKQPEVELKNFHLLYFPNGTLTVKVDLVVKVNNPNYSTFKYKNTTVKVWYREVIAAEVPVGPRLLPARGEVDFNVSAHILAYKMLSSPEFLDDLSLGRFNFTASAALEGKVRALKLLKLHARAFCTCHVFYFIMSSHVEATCIVTIKL